MPTSFALLDPAPVAEDAHARFARLHRATLDRDAPFAVLDLAALTRNARDLTRRAAGTPIRVASKSVRSRAVLEAVLAEPGFAGVLAFTLAEAIHLVRSGTSDDVVVAYPTAERAALAELGASPHLAGCVTLMIDDADQLDLIDRSAPGHVELRVCIDLDCSLRLARVHLGALRSPVASVEDAVALARRVVERPGFRLVGLMGYEAQVAGVTDAGRVVRAMKRRSIAELATRRSAVVAAVREVADLEFVNGGGTGSIESTCAEGCVTEVAAGSGLFGPHLFDHYEHFTPEPAVVFALAVTRRPAPGVVTVHGGGWVASGAAGGDRLPRPVWPQGLSLVKAEGAGEVQTPLRCRLGVPAIGDRVWWRHTKAGEVCEHVNHLHVVDGDEVVASVDTYRGEGRAFL